MSKAQKMIYNRMRARMSASAKAEKPDNATR